MRDSSISGSCREKTKSEAVSFMDAQLKNDKRGELLLRNVRGVNPRCSRLRRRVCYFSHFSGIVSLSDPLRDGQ